MARRAAVGAACLAVLLLAAACSEPPTSGDLVTSAELSGLDYPAQTYLGETGSELSVVVKNTGNTRSEFGVTAALLKPDRQSVVELPLRVITLVPGQAKTVSWGLAQWRPVGLWDVRATVWRDVEPELATPLADTGWLLNAIATGFRVRYHTTTSGMTLSGADTRLADGQQLLWAKNAADDVPCPVTFQQFGSPESYTSGDGIIDNQGEFNLVVSVPGSLKLVHQINWCSTIGAGIIGCSPIPGFSVIVQEHQFGIRDGELWAHEYGHAVGLHHNPLSGYLMYATQNGLDTGNKVTERECSSFLTGP